MGASGSNGWVKCLRATWAVYGDLAGAASSALAANPPTVRKFPDSVCGFTVHYHMLDGDCNVLILTYGYKMDVLFHLLPIRFIQFNPIHCIF